MSDSFKKIRRRIWLVLNIGVVFWLLAGVLCLQVPPQEFWPAGFVAFSLPGALVLNFFFLLYWVLSRSWLFVLPLTVLLLGWNYYARLLAINFDQEPPKGAKALQVLSFNTHMFNAYLGQTPKEAEAAKEMIEWIAQHPADVYCLQEFYSKRHSNLYNTISKIGVRYNKHRFFSVANVDREKGDIGVAIFSIYPIIEKGVINFNKSSANRVIWTDLDVKGDTVRIYAAHLQSMSIKSEDIENTYSAIGNEESFKREGRNLARRLRNGFVARGEQVDILLEHVRESPYRAIVCGDFNDIPFSYTYNELAEVMENAFVKAGTGIGATYNGPLPFLRIDNQFYTTGLRAVGFETHHEMSLSDHYPISATYVVEPRTEEAR